MKLHGSSANNQKVNPGGHERTKDLQFIRVNPVPLFLLLVFVHAPL